MLNFGTYILNYTTNENIVLILEAIQAQIKTEFLIQLHSGILSLLQQRVALVLAQARSSNQAIVGIFLCS